MTRWYWQIGMILRGFGLAAGASSGRAWKIVAPGTGSDDLALSLWFQDVNENFVRSKHIGVGVVVAACKH